MDYPVENPMVLPSGEKPSVGVAHCEYCNMRLFADESFLEMDGDYYCDQDCVIESLPIRQIEGWEI